MSQVTKQMTPSVQYSVQVPGLLKLHPCRRLSDICTSETQYSQPQYQVGSPAQVFTTWLSPFFMFSVSPLAPDILIHRKTLGWH